MKTGERRKLTRCQRFKRFLYNKEKGSYLGRTPWKWCRIIIFYIIFYSVVFAIFHAYLTIMVKYTIPKSEPKWQLEDSLITSSPALSFRPFKRLTGDDAIIEFGQSEDSYRKWVDKINKFLEPYRDQKPEDYYNCSETSVKGKLCMFPVESLGPCKEEPYGYNKAKPCVYIKINRIFNWEPGMYEEGHIPKSVKHVAVAGKKMVWIKCRRDNEEKNKTLKIKYYPSNQAISGKYFPFTNQKGYLSPLVAVKINSVPGKTAIKCGAFSSNIRIDYFKEDGSVTFTIHID